MVTWQKIVLGLGVGVVVLLVLVNPSFMIPTPMQVLNKDMRSTFLPTKPEQATGSQGAGAQTLEKKMIAPSDVSVMPYPEPGIVPPYGGEEDLTSPERYIVRNASLGLEVKEVGKAVEDGSKYVTSIGGLVSNSSVSKTQKGYIGYLTARVPEAKLTEAVQYFKSLAVTVTEENISAYDETSQVNFAKNRKQTLEEQLLKYQKLLQQATTAEEKLRIQQQIDQLEEQIKNWDKQEQNLKQQAAMSQLSVNFTEKKLRIPLLEELGLGDVVTEAVWTLKRVALALVVLAIWIVIFAPIWLPIILVVRWLKKRK